MLRRVVPAMLLCAVALPAMAGDITLSTNTGDRFFTRTVTADAQGHYTYDTELGEEVTEIALDPAVSAHIKRIDYSHTTAWAVGEDGPWVSIPNTEATSAWAEIPVTSLKDGKMAFNLPYQEPKLVFDDVLRAKAATDLKTDPDTAESADRWVPLLEKCTPQAEHSPCYTYHSKDTLRYTLDSGGQFDITVTFPGGC